MGIKQLIPNMLSNRSLGSLDSLGFHYLAYAGEHRANGNRTVRLAMRLLLLLRLKQNSSLTPKWTAFEQYLVTSTYGELDSAVR